MKSKKKPSRQEMIASCAEIGPDDGIDPREFVSEGRRRHSNRKALQLCRQVAEALNGALARSGMSYSAACSLWLCNPLRTPADCS